MVHRCCIPNCGNKINATLSFHTFPTKKELHYKWRTATTILTPGKSQKVCSDHFLESDYWPTSYIKRLKKNAVPSVFPWTPKPNEYSLLLVINHNKTEDEDTSNGCTSLLKTSSKQTESTLKIDERISVETSNNRSPLIYNEAEGANTKTTGLFKGSTTQKENNKNYTSKARTIFDTILENHPLKDDLNASQTQIKQLRLQLQSVTAETKPIFCIEQFANDNSKILYYTGIQTYSMFNIIFNVLLPSGDIKNLELSSMILEKNKLCCGQLSPKNQLFLTLMKFRRELNYKTLGSVFGISTVNVCKISLCWINCMYVRLGNLNIWRHRNILLQHVPKEFQEKYPKVIGSIVCTEFVILKPSSFLPQSQYYSNCKNTTTLKGLLMTAPNGAILYMSQLLSGSISDKQIVKDSGFLDILKKKVREGIVHEEDIILADQGFKVASLFKNIDIDLNIPVVRISGMKFNSEDLELARKTAYEHIHVEKTIGSLKSLKILKHEIPISLLSTIEQSYFVCCLLTNFRHPILE